jgi:hypothetical protein
VPIRLGAPFARLCLVAEDSLESLTLFRYGDGGEASFLKKVSRPSAPIRLRLHWEGAELLLRLAGSVSRSRLAVRLVDACDIVSILWAKLSLRYNVHAHVELAWLTPFFQVKG